MTINASPHYKKAEQEYLLAETTQQRIVALKKMLSLAPVHKGSENLRAQLKKRLAKLKNTKEKESKRIKRKIGIKKEGIQVVLVGLTKSGKSSLLASLTNAKPEISEIEFTTRRPNIGVLYFEGIKFQIIDMPAINYETFDQGLANLADILLIIITNISDLEIIVPCLEKSIGKRIVVLNKTDLLNNTERRKIQATLQSNRHNFCLVSCKTQSNIEELKKKLVENSQVIRVYTKEPGKLKDENPILMKLNSSAEDLSKRIFHPNIKVKEIIVTGPSSKFPNQRVGLKHILQDKDIVEFHVE